jgi:hypothetical protein
VPVVNTLDYLPMLDELGDDYLRLIAYHATHIAVHKQWQPATEIFSMSDNVMSRKVIYEQYKALVKT